LVKISHVEGALPKGATSAEKEETEESGDPAVTASGVFVGRVYPTAITQPSIVATRTVWDRRYSV
jgi:hypothetical protein